MIKKLKYFYTLYNFILNLLMIRKLLLSFCVSKSFESEKQKLLGFKGFKNLIRNKRILMTIFA